MKSILETIANIFAKDKLLHFFYGSIISFLMLHFIDGLITLILVAGIGVGKELYDIDKTGFSFIDIIFTVMPAIMYLAILNQ